MKVTIEFEDNDAIYTVDFLKLAAKLHISEDRVRRAVLEMVSKS